MPENFNEPKLIILVRILILFAFGIDVVKKIIILNVSEAVRQEYVYYGFIVQYNSSIVDYYIDYYKNFYGLEKDFTLSEKDIRSTDSVNVLEREGRLINKDTLGALLQYVKPRFKMKEGDHYIVAKILPYRHWDTYQRRLYDLYSDNTSYHIIEHEPYTDIRRHSNVNNLGLTDMSFEEIKDSLQKNGQVIIKRPGSSIKEAKENVKWYNNFIFSAGEVKDRVKEVK